MRRRSLLIAVSSFVAGCVQPAAQAPASRVVVFFTADSAALDDPALGSIRQAAEVPRENPSAPVQVLGFAAPDTGTTAFNRALAQARAQGVADALVASGVPSARIRVASR